MRGGVAHEVLDHVTDGAAIVALAWLSAHSAEPLSTDIIAAIATIALGQRYAKHKWSSNGPMENDNGK